MQIRAYENPHFRKLSVWEASGSVADPAAITDSAATRAGMRCTEQSWYREYRLF